MIQTMRTAVGSIWLALAMGAVILGGSAPEGSGAPQPAGTGRVAVAPQMILGANGEGKKAQELLQAGHPSEARAVAEKDLQTSIAQSGFSSFGNMVSYNNLAVAYTAEGKYAEAHKLFARAIGLGRAAVSQGLMAAGYSAGSTYTQAGAGSGKGVAVQKKILALCLFNNSIAYRREGDLVKAARFQADARKLDPSLPELK
ncbi:MAG: tetratricopeptide repeat protein [Methylacidiphilaceae bacterium]|nr:tetratricopeptide repeat protein [Candidatus Methylacidiphilaceae bacterium]